MYRNSPLFLIGLIFLISSCERAFEYSPYQELPSYEHEGLNTVNKNLIISDFSDADSLRIAIIADNHTYYKSFQSIVDRINETEDVDFAIHLGDMTDGGLWMEYNLMTDIMDKLEVPYLGIIGNHDCLSNGKHIFNDVFGPCDFYLDLGQYRFIFINDIAWEMGLETPKLDSLESFLQNTGDKIPLVFAHIPPDTDQFSAEGTARYFQLMETYGVAFSCHGHQHNYLHYFVDQTEYLIAPWTRNEAYIILTISKQGVRHELKEL